MQSDREGTFSMTDSVGTTTVSTWLDESKGLHAYRTEVSREQSTLQADIWSTVADTPERAKKNHASGLVQAADVELAAWMNGGATGPPPGFVAQAAGILGLSPAELLSWRNEPAEQAAESRRKRAAQRIVEIESA